MLSQNKAKLFFVKPCSLIKTFLYRIRAYSTPLLIKPPLQPNLNKPPLFCPKSPLFEAFWGKNPKNFNKPPPNNPQIFINCQRSICGDTVFGIRCSSRVYFSTFCQRPCNKMTPNLQC